MIICIVCGLLAFMCCVFGDGMGSYDALKGNVFTRNDNDVDRWKEYVDSCNIDGDLSPIVNGALGLYLGAFLIIVLLTVWALSIARGCPLCCSPCDERDRACCANTYLAFSIIFLFFSMCFLLWMIVLMSLDKYSCNTCHDPSNDIGTVNNILNTPGDCIVMNYVSVERAGIGTLGGFFGFLALLFAGLYCIGVHPQRPLPMKLVPKMEVPQSIPLHLIHMDVPLPDHEVPIVEAPMMIGREAPATYMAGPAEHYVPMMSAQPMDDYGWQPVGQSMPMMGSPGMVGNVDMSRQGHA